MAEVAVTGEDHGHVAFVGGGDHFFIADGSAGLDGGFGSGIGRSKEAVSEGEERVAGNDAAIKREAGFLGFPDGDTAGIDAGHLPGTNAEGAV